MLELISEFLARAIMQTGECPILTIELSSCQFNACLQEAMADSFPNMQYNSQSGELSFIWNGVKIKSCKRGGRYLSGDYQVDVSR